MGQGKQPWLAFWGDGHRSDHVESEQAQQGEVFLSQGLLLWVRPDQPKAPQRSRACSKGSQRRWRGLGTGPDQNILHRSTPGDDQADGAPNFMRKLCESFCRFRR